MSVDQENEICGNCGVTIVCNNGVWVHTPEEWEISSEPPECRQPEPLTAEQRELACRPSAFMAASELIAAALTKCSSRPTVQSSEVVDVLLDLQNHLNDLHRTALFAVKAWMESVDQITETNGPD